jgi:hypothetical protein
LGGNQNGEEFIAFEASFEQRKLKILRLATFELNDEDLEIRNQVNYDLLFLNF